MIKLEVDHNKHPNNSGAKLEIKKNNKDDKGKSVEKDLKIIAEDKEKDKKEKDDKKDKKDKKGKKDEKKIGKEEAQPEGKGKKGKDDKKDGKDKKDKKDKGKGKSPDKEERRSPRKKDDVQLDTIKSIHKSQNKAKMTIEELIAQYKDAANQILFNNHNGHDPTKQKQIEQQLQSLQKQKQKRHKKLEDLSKHKEQLYNSRQKQKQLKRQLREQKMRQKKIKRIEQKLGNLQISAEERKAEYQKFLQYVKERKQFKPRFKRYEQEFKESLQEAEEDYKQKLDEIVKKYEPMNKHDLDHFQENYMLQKEETDNYRENKIKLEQDMIEEENEKIRKKLWRGQCHRNVREEMDLQLDKKKEPKDKLESMREYGKMVADQHIKDREKKAAEKEQQQKSEQQEEIDKEKLHVHEKYFKGVNYGLVSDQKTLPLSIQQKLKLGNVYLEHAREMAKQKKNKTVDVTNTKKLNDSQQLVNRSGTFKVKRVANPYYPSLGNRKSLDFSNYETIEYSLEKIESLATDRKLQDQIIRHGEYSGILQIQQRKRKVGSLIVKQINEKLDLLKKL